MREIKHVKSEPIPGNDQGMYRNIWLVTADSGIQYRVVTWQDVPNGIWLSMCGCGQSQCQHGRQVIRSQAAYHRMAERNHV